MDGKNLRILLSSKMAVKLEDYVLAVVRKPLPKTSRSAPD